MEEEEEEEVVPICEITTRQSPVKPHKGAVSPALLLQAASPLVKCSLGQMIFFLYTSERDEEAFIYANLSLLCLRFISCSLKIIPCPAASHRGGVTMERSDPSALGYAHWQL